MKVNTPPTRDKIQFPHSRSWSEWWNQVYEGFKNLGLLKKVHSTTKTIDFGSIGAYAVATNDVTLTGVKLNATNPARVIVTAATPTTSIVYHGYVQANNTVRVIAQNIKNANVDPASSVFAITVLEY